MNLVMNGIKAMAGVRNRPMELMIGSHPTDGEHITVAVHDTGVGIDPSHLDRLYNAFFTTKRGGMGMGLSMSRSIIEAHGGRLWAAPNLPHGAIFRLSLAPASAVAMLGDVAKWSQRIVEPATMSHWIRQALRDCMQPNPGPVVLEVKFAAKDE